MTVEDLIELLRRMPGVVFCRWPNRAAMARSIRMQERRESRPDDWRACIKLETTEGY